MSDLTLLGIVFSRDRAMQLDAMLRSLIRHCEDFQQANFCLIYRVSNPQHARQYLLLMRQFGRFQNIHFIAQDDFRSDVHRCILVPRAGEPVSRGFGKLLALGWQAGILKLLSNKESYLLFLVDDNLFISDFSLSSILHSLIENQKALGFSLRLGLNTTNCYITDRSQKLADYRNLKGQIIEYDWLRAEGDFGYPLEISSSVYRRRDLLDLIARLSFDNPNTLESMLASSSDRFIDLRPAMLCYERSVTFCNPINKVQEVFDNRAGGCSNYSSQSLADLFDDGYRIDIDALSAFTPSACHQEVGLAFTRMSGEVK